MKIEVDYKFGQPVYIKHDPEQKEYRLNRIILEQKNLVTLELINCDGESIEVSEIHCSKEIDTLKKAGIDQNSEE